MRAATIYSCSTDRSPAPLDRFSLSSTGPPTTPTTGYPPTECCIGECPSGRGSRQPEMQGNLPCPHPGAQWRRPHIPSGQVSQIASWPWWRRLLARNLQAHCTTRKRPATGQWMLDTRVDDTSSGPSKHTSVKDATTVDLASFASSLLQPTQLMASAQLAHATDLPHSVRWHLKIHEPGPGRPTSSW